jgi:hypothetical protein
VKWALTPFDRNSAVFSYRIKFQRKDGVFIVHPYCDGTSIEIIQNLSCTVSMVSLLLPTFALVEGDQIKVTIEALNTIGYSHPSPESGLALV